jgi:glutamate receptor, ionotropic, plant
MAADRLSLSSFWGLFLICGIACFIALLIYFARVLRQYCRYHSNGDSAGGSSSFPDPEGSARRPARLASIRDLITFIDMKEEVKMGIRTKSHERSMGGSSSQSRPSSSMSPA